MTEHLISQLKEISKDLAAVRGSPLNPVDTFQDRPADGISLLPAPPTTAPPSPPPSPPRAAPQIDNTFKHRMKELSSIEDQIDKLNEQLTKLRSRKAELRDYASGFMVQQGIDTIKVSGKESFSMVMSKAKQNPLTKSRITESLQNFLVQNDSMPEAKARDKAEFMLKWMNDSAEISVTHSLRRKIQK